MFTYEKTKVVQIGDVRIGGGHPICIQSMTNTKTADIAATVAQIQRLEEAGCEIVRVTVPDAESAEALTAIKKEIHIPLVADIHFDYRLAILAMENGADKIRINPGNLGGFDRLKKVVAVAKERQIPIRVGVNSGSVEPDLLTTYGSTPKALAESALRNVQYLEDLDFDAIVVSIKASEVERCTAAYEAFAEKKPYPLHIGITEAGTMLDGSIKSALGLGILLHEGLGDTLRVSLTDDPVEEIKAARKILQFMGKRRFGPEFISCPTCGRTQIDLIELTKRAQEALSAVEKPIKVAIMGCAVNGPGEAREADIGIAGGRGEGLLFKKGEILCKLPEKELLAALVAEVNKL